MKLTLSVRSFQVPANTRDLGLGRRVFPRCRPSRADARHFRCERIELVHHRIDGVFQFENLAADVEP